MVLGWYVKAWTANSKASHHMNHYYIQKKGQWKVFRALQRLLSSLHSCHLKWRHFFLPIKYRHYRYCLPCEACQWPNATTNSTPTRRVAQKPLWLYTETAISLFYYILYKRSIICIFNSITFLYPNKPFIYVGNISLL